jgi:hypothetical protein
MKTDIIVMWLTLSLIELGETGVSTVVYVKLVLCWVVWLRSLVSFLRNVMLPFSGQERDVTNFLHKSNHALVSAPQKEGR